MIGGARISFEVRPSVLRAAKPLPDRVATYQTSDENLAFSMSVNQLPGVDLTGLGMPGCRLFAGLDSITQFATPFLSASVPLALPNTPSLAGAEVISQSATLTPNLNAFGFAVSNGLLLLLGTL